MAPLYTTHARALAVLHSDIEAHAEGQAQAFLGSAGTVLVRTNASAFRFYAHQSYGADGKKHERYVAGPVGAAEADAVAAALRERIHEIKELVPSLRLLGREGYSVVDAKTYATIASLHNHGVFRAGGMLVGSHAYGVLLNRLGIRAAAYVTEDIDIARGAKLAFDVDPPPFVEMLKGAGVEFVEVPSLDRKGASTSFKQRGRSLFHVDLLVPSPDESFPTVAVPELAAHAKGLPYLAYLLAESQPGMLMAREGCCAVRVPLPERFAVHKLIVSQLRTGRNAKSAKDVRQACVLAAALAASHPGALEEAVAHVPARARKHLVGALVVARDPLEVEHPRAWAELGA